jgi:hypothetical protein
VPAPAPAPALAPLAGGSSYLGTLSFGDTVALSLDSTTKQITLRFVDSRFGLAGAITSVYRVDANGQFVAQTFQAVAGSNLPGALVSRLSDVTLRFSAETGLVTGNVDGLPNLLDTSASSTASLQGVLTASNQGRHSSVHWPAPTTICAMRLCIPPLASPAHPAPARASCALPMTALYASAPARAQATPAPTASPVA